MVSSEKGMVLRGGAWSGIAENLRSSSRINLGANSRNYFVGFRIVVEL
jgi:formylglycine-generating enzyme required for sulfatase activity